MEENFKDSDFIRINKSVIINMSKIKTLRPLLNSKIEVTFLSNEKQIVTRSYIKAFKKMLNL
ncbi:LytTR family DNA-binding domain-containing protein [Clostridium sp. Marseille-QA1073]